MRWWTSVTRNREVPILECAEDRGEIGPRAGTDPRIAAYPEERE